MVRLKSKKNELPESCLIIGSGVGGLSLGALFAKKGVKVTILEAHTDAIGGLAQTISGNGYKFTFGPRYLWGFGNGEIGSRFLEHLEINEKINMIELDRNGFDHIFLDGRQNPIPVPNNWQEYKVRLKKEFSDDSKALDEFFKISESSYEFLDFADKNGLYFKSWPASFFKLIAKFWMRPLDILKFSLRMTKTFQAVCDDCKLSDSVQSVLYAHGLIFAETQQNLSFYAYVGATLHYVRASYFPAVGMLGFITVLASIIRENGGRIILGAEVAQLTTDGKKNIKSVQTTDGKTFSSDLIVANIEPKAFNRFFEGDPGGYKAKQLPNYKYSESLTSVFIGIKDRSVLEPRFGKWNLWLCAQSYTATNLYNTHPLTSPERMYLNAPSLIDNRMSDAPPGGATLTAFVPASYSAFKSAYDESPEAHDQLLKQQEQLILEVIDNRFVPGINEQIDFIKTISPYEVSIRFKAPLGNVYGKAFRPREVLIKLPCKSKLENLYYVGQYTAFAGVANAIMSACHVFGQVTNEEI